MNLIQQNQMTSESILIACHRCEYKWTYKGNNPFYCCCPRCRTTIRIGKNYSLDKGGLNA
jgi:uncharacterized paraquat-inducible protein A